MFLEVAAHMIQIQLSMSLFHSDSVYLSMLGSFIEYLGVYSILRFPLPCFLWDKLQRSGTPRETYMLTDRASLATIAQLIGGIVAAAMTDALLPGKLVVDTKIGGMAVHNSSDIRGHQYFSSSISRNVHDCRTRSNSPYGTSHSFHY